MERWTIDTPRLLGDTITTMGAKTLDDLSGAAKRVYGASLLQGYLQLQSTWPAAPIRQELSTTLGELLCMIWGTLRDRAVAQPTEPVEEPTLELAKGAKSTKVKPERPLKKQKTDRALQEEGCKYLDQVREQRTKASATARKQKKAVAHRLTNLLD